MLLITKRLVYTLRTETQNWTAKQIGVSQSTISRWSRELSPIPSEYNDIIRNMYEKEAYSNLRKLGVSSTQANRFKWYTPDTVLDVEGQMVEKVDFLTKGWLGKTTHTIGGEFTGKELEELYDVGKDIIKDALRQSKEPLEVIFDYGKRK